MAIELQNQIPASGALNVPAATNIQVDIIRLAPPLALSEVEIYVEGDLALGGGMFQGQFSGSSAVPIANGFRVTLVRLTDYRKEFINTQVRQSDGYNSAPVGGWSFRVGDDPVSDFYFSDGYGVRRLHVRQLVGEWKPYEDPADGYLMPVVLSTAVTPDWPSDTVRALAGAKVDGYLFLIASTDKGVAVTKGETGDLRIHARPSPPIDGYDSLAAHMTENGILYLINKTLNRLEVYYGADFRSPARQPDFWYDKNSTPPLVDGYLSALHVAESRSTVFGGGSRLYVGCSRNPDGSGGGLTKIEAYDKEQPDGYCAGMDGYGRSYTYGIAGSPTDYPVLGGTAADVVAVDSDEDGDILFVATNNGSETGGGLSQLSISRNARLLFMTKEGGFLPSNIVRDIAAT